jgi:AcrR family transcriptional regulator
MKGTTKRTRDSEATKEALLRAATELFARDGYEGVRVDAIARRAGVNKALISYYFRGKQNLYRAAIESSFREVFHLAERLRDQGRPPLELLADFVSGFADLATHVRPHFPALFLREVLSTGEAAPEAVDYIIGIVRRFQEVLARGASEGTLRPIHPAHLYLHLVGGLAFFYATEPARSRLAKTGRLPVPLPAPDVYVSFLQDALVRILAPENHVESVAKSSRPRRPLKKARGVHR